MEIVLIAFALFCVVGFVDAADPVWTAPVVGSASTSIDENSDTGTSVTELTATDGDSDQLTYSITSQTYGDNFEIDTNIVKVKAGAVLDYESHTSHELVFSVTDGTTPVESVPFTVNLNDVNDVVPVFNPSSYEEDVYEKESEDTSVVTVTATDGDATAGFQTFTYSIKSGDTNSNFKIDSSSGLISTTSTALLYSNGATVNLVIAATDGVGNEGTASVTVHVKTVPVFGAPVAGSATASVPENSPAETSVFDVVTSDADGNAPSLTLLSQDPGNNFELVGSQLRVADGAVLDFESVTTSYTVVFRATDDDSNVVDSVNLIVSVTNVNEAPTFVQSPMNFDLQAGLTPPQDILIMGATDPDDGDTITYTMSGGGSDFSINENTGRIQTASSIAYTSTPFDLEITATDSAGAATTGQVIITMISAPVLTMPVANGVSPETVNENSPIGTIVAPLTSTDEDGDSPTYTIVSQSVPDAFAISGSNLITNTEFDFETQPNNYEVVIKVTDDSSRQLTSSGTISISEVGVSEHTPVFNPTSYSKTIKEQIGAQPSFLQVAATDGDDGESITYSITGSSLFDIDSTTGYISTNADLVYLDATSYSLTVTATDGTNSAQATVEVTVIEMTDPVFTLPPEAGGATLSVAEDTGMTISIYSISATDDDGDTLTYVLTAGSPEFSLDESTRVVSVAAALDFDTDPKVYEITFEARDENDATSTGTLTVSLTDVNDNAPVFTGTPYTAEAQEGQASSTQIIQVTAEDADSSHNDYNTIQFYILSGNTDNKFTIDATTGWISASNLDYGTQNTYTLVIAAKDLNGANGAHETTVNVLVNVVTAPVLTTPTANTVTEETVSEDAALGDTVVTLASTDEDGNTPEYSIVSQTTPGAFDISGSNLVTNTQFDFETEPNTYEVVIKVTDSSSIKLSSTGTLSITEVGVNEHTPVFSPTSYTETIKEQIGAQSSFLQVIATDADAGESITYSISGSPLFEIDSSTGYISTNADLVFANAASYSLTVTATDGAKSVDASVDITVKEQSDPVFTLPPEADGATIPLAEDTATDTAIYTISATDDDGDTLTYVLTAGSPEFSLTTRIVKVAATLDYDTDPKQYEITFEARDENAATSTGTLTVSLTDVNDNDPVFTGTPYSANALEGQSSSTQIFQVAATDADSSLNNYNAIHFSIKSGNTDNKFTIDATTGWISASNLDYETLSTYTLVIAAKDLNGANGAHETTVNVEVSVVTAPVWSTPDTDNAQVSMDEDIASGGSVYTLLASDEDGDTVSYSIESQTPANAFVLAGAQINAGATPFDADAEGATTSYTLTLRASDGTYNTDRNIVITVADVNDNSPVFDPASYTESLWDGEATGTSVVTIMATDEDAHSDFNTISYSITAGNDGNAFTIEDNGQINVAAALDYGTQSSYSLTVQASDGTNTADATVTINLFSKPKWSTPPSSDFAVNIDEDIASGGSVYTLAATDADSAQITYSIVSQTPPNMFALDGAQINAGSTPFDVDVANPVTTYTLEVRASDGTHDTDSSIVITVVDVNDISPVFDPSSYTDSLWEGEAVGTSVTTVAATDADVHSDFNTLSYSITSGNDGNAFTMVDSQINVAAALDYGTQSSYSLTVQASDGTNTADATVTINLYTKPKWSTPPSSDFAVNMDEDIASGGPVYTLAATDEDNDQVSYSILSQTPSSPADMFVLAGAQINAGSGDFDVDVANPVTTYTLAVRASSGGDNVDSSIVITVVDINESPVFDPVNYAKSLWEGEPTGTSVTTVTATDPDTSPNYNSLTYTITAGNTGNAFTMDGSQINTATALNYGTTNTYTLTVQVSDGTNTADATVTVTLKTRPVFTLPPVGGATEDVAENIDTAFVIYTINVDDEDNEVVTTTMTQSPGEKFKLTANELKLNTGQTLDFENDPHEYTLSFTARDASGNEVTSDNVVLTLTDENDNTPTFTDGLFSRTMKTTAAAGATVVTIPAEDADSAANNNNHITYSINSGNTNNDFAISSTGEVTIVNQLTMTPPNYNLEIYAVDGGTPPNTGSTTLTVTVAQPSDPVITVPAVGGASISIPENQALNSVIYTVEASDDDGDTLTYSIKTITPSSDPKFTISGADLQVSEALDYESVTSYTIIFEVDDEDGNTANKVTSPALTITITDINEHTPAFTQTSYEKTVKEKINSGDLVITVSATDGDGAQVTYSITGGNGNGYFSIAASGASAGEITTTTDWPPDGAADEATLTVQASDGSLSSNVNVKVKYNIAARASITLSMLILSLTLYKLFVSL